MSTGNLYATRAVGDRLVVVCLALMEDSDYKTAIDAVTEVWQGITPMEPCLDQEEIPGNPIKE